MNINRLKTSVVRVAKVESGKNRVVLRVAGFSSDLESKPSCKGQGWG